MFSRLSLALLFVLASFTIFAAAGGTTVTVTTTAIPPGQTGIPPTQCSTGDIQCCNSTQSASSGGLVGLLLGLLGVVVSPLNAIVGLTCNPISIIGIGGNSCTGQVVCCQNNNFSGIIAIGCTPININL